MDDHEIGLRREFADEAYLNQLLAVAQRLQDQLEASWSVLDGKARFLLTLDAGFLGVLLAMMGVPTVIAEAVGGLPRSPAIGLVWAPLLVALASFLGALPFLLSAYRPRPGYLDVPPAGLANVLAQQLEPLAGRYNILASTVDSAVRSQAHLSSKAARLEQGARLLQVGVFAFVVLIGSVALARFMLGGAS